VHFTFELKFVCGIKTEFPLESQRTVSTTATIQMMQKSRKT